MISQLRQISRCKSVSRIGIQTLRYYSVCKEESIGDLLQAAIDMAVFPRPIHFEKPIPNNLQHEESVETLLEAATEMASWRHQVCLNNSDLTNQHEESIGLLLQTAIDMASWHHPTNHCSPQNSSPRRLTSHANDDWIKLLLKEAEIMAMASHN